MDTFLDIKEIRAGIIAVREVSVDIPIIAMLTFDDNGRSVLGTPPEAAAITLEAAGADCQTIVEIRIGIDVLGGPVGARAELTRVDHVIVAGRALVTVEPGGSRAMPNDAGTRDVVVLRLLDGLNTARERRARASPGGTPTRRRGSPARARPCWWHSR